MLWVNSTPPSVNVKHMFPCLYKDTCARNTSIEKVIGNVTVVVWHLYLFGYVLVVYVWKVQEGITCTNRDSKSLWSPI